jgi:hypothetical protein
VASFNHPGRERKAGSIGTESRDDAERGDVLDAAEARESLIAAIRSRSTR